MPFPCAVLACADERSWDLDIDSAQALPFAYGFVGGKDKSLISVFVCQGYRHFTCKPMDFRIDNECQAVRYLYQVGLPGVVCAQGHRRVAAPAEMKIDPDRLPYAPAIQKRPDGLPCAWSKLDYRYFPLPLSEHDI